MASKLQRQIDHYKSMEAELLQNCYGKFIVVGDNLDIYVMDTIGDAYKLGCAAYGRGNFMLKECVKRELDLEPYILRRVGEGGTHE